MPSQNDPDVILTVFAGSHAHGINTETSDYDYLSIRLAPLSTTLGIAPPIKTTQTRTAPQGVRASAGDIEHTTYELRHFMQLATQGNPNILVPLYAASQHVIHTTVVGDSLRGMAGSIVSRQAVRRHLGYLDAQLGRMLGQGPHQARKPNRPELVAAHGYDTKYAAHALRLGWQGVELARHGALTLPMEAAPAEFLRGIRAGYVEQQEVLDAIQHARVELVSYVDGQKACRLPEEPDWNLINAWLEEVQVDR